MTPEMLTPDEIEKAAQLVRQGRLVAFPTDTVYGVAALADEGFDSVPLREFKGGRQGPFSLHFGGTSEALAVANPQGILEPQALRRLTPRGVTVIVADEHTGRGLGCRVVRHDVGSKFLSSVGRPVVATSANLHGTPPLNDPREIARLPGLDAVIDSGALPDRPASTLVRMLPSGLEILREGAVPRDELAGLFTMKVEFVCLGNLNRSAFAKGLAYAVQQWWRRRVGRYVPAFEFYSSGLIAAPDTSPPPGMIQAARACGVDLGGHRPTRFDPARCARADVAIAMGEDVFDEVRRAHPDALCWDIHDPMGGPPEGYERTAGEVRQAWLAALARLPCIRDADDALEADYLKVFSGQGGQP